MKRNTQLLSINGVLLALFLAGWAVFAWFATELMAGLIEKAFLRAEGSNFFDLLSADPHWRIAVALIYVAPALSVISFVALSCRQRFLVAWVATLAIHFISVLLITTLALSAYMYTAWALW
jgi:hypothetical protein